MNDLTDNKPYDDINITPMLDVAYVLLLIFIIMTTATIQGITIDLPKSSLQPMQVKPRTKAISITREGKIYLDAYPVSRDELEAILLQLKAANGDLPVVLKADANIPYQHVMNILDILARLEITQIGLVTERQTP
jgi:biopolymer transport protein ExbD